MFNLNAHVAEHPIGDKPYVRQLQTADVFNELEEARRAARESQFAVEQAERIRAKAQTRYEAAKAKAKLMESMADL